MLTSSNNVIRRKPKNIYKVNRVALNTPRIARAFENTVETLVEAYLLRLILFRCEKELGLGFLESIHDCIFVPLFYVPAVKKIIVEVYTEVFTDVPALMKHIFKDIGDNPRDQKLID